MLENIAIFALSMILIVLFLEIVLPGKKVGCVAGLATIKPLQINDLKGFWIYSGYLLFAGSLITFQAPTRNTIQSFCLVA